jgi:ArsC family
MPLCASVIRIPYEELGLASAQWSDSELVDHMMKYPILINRPIVVTRWGVKLCVFPRLSAMGGHFAVFGNQIP